jgi:predicted dehydrogenase
VRRRRSSLTPFGVGLIGCGTISSAYLQTLKRVPTIDVASCFDLESAASARVAQRFRVRQCDDVDELLADEDVSIVLNLTPPAAHRPVSEAALRAGKHVYTEKPLAASFVEGLRLVRLAERVGRRLGAAPDTFLGVGWQTARRAVDAGVIGSPVAIEASFQCSGHEEWHERPHFYYQPGGGPLFDMGPYYITGLVALLGPVRRVTAAAGAAFAERTIKAGPQQGTTFRVETPSHIAGVLEFAQGAIATLTTSFDVSAPVRSRVLLFGTEGTLALPDPNGFGGTVRLWHPLTRKWAKVTPTTSRGRIQRRGLGLIEMTETLADGTSKLHRANSELALHVLEVMDAVLEAAHSGEHRVLRTSAARPEPFDEEPL